MLEKGDQFGGDFVIVDLDCSPTLEPPHEKTNNVVSEQVKHKTEEG